ncbi:MAG: hypothetical protein P8176_03375 [Gammaproteobacteria bacterium]
MAHYPHNLTSRLTAFSVNHDTLRNITRFTTWPWRTVRHTFTLTVFALLLSGCLGGEENRVFGSRDIIVNVVVKDRLDNPSTTYARGETIIFEITFQNTSENEKQLRWQGPLAIVTVSNSSGVPVFANGLVELAEISDGPVQTATLPPGGNYKESITWVGINNVDPNALFSNDPRVAPGNYSYVVTGRAAIDQNPNIPLLDSGFVLTSDSPLVITP